jgi:hypothetical protein
VIPDSSWPPVAQELDDLEWRLRYRPPTPSDCLAAASIVSAYRELVLATRRRREEIVRGLRNV